MDQIQSINPMDSSTSLLMETFYLTPKVFFKKFPPVSSTTPATFLTPESL